MIQEQLTDRILETFDLALRVSTSRSNCCFQSESWASSCHSFKIFRKPPRINSFYKNGAFVPMHCIPVVAEWKFYLEKAQLVASLSWELLYFFHAAFQSYPAHSNEIATRIRQLTPKILGGGGFYSRTTTRINYNNKAIAHGLNCKTVVVCNHLLRYKRARGGHTTK